MRHLLLDLMLVYADRKSGGGRGLDPSDSAEELLFFLLLHTAGRELAEAYVAQMGSLTIPVQQKIKKWTDESGILMEEWAMISTNWPQVLGEHDQMSPEPVAASKPTTWSQIAPEWMRDYAVRVFISTRNFWDLSSGIAQLQSRGLALTDTWTMVVDGPESYQK
jgi:hypothetical protein